MYESGVSMGKKDSDSSILYHAPKHSKKKREFAFVMDNVVRGW